jgi:hypothetical protein
MSCRTVFLPPIQPQKGEGYDLHQFSKVPKMVGKTSGISLDDLSHDATGKTSGMHVIYKMPSVKPIPLWTNSDEKIKRVVAHMLWRMAHMTGVGFPEERFQKEPLALALELEDKLKKRCIDFFQVRNQRAQLSIVGQKRSKKYGYALLLSSIIYQRYRMNKKSNEISADFKELVSPVGVRQLLSRANVVARIIFPPEDSLPVRKDSNGRMARDLEWKRARFGESKKSGKKRSLPTPEECFQLVQSGRTAVDISREYECNLSSIETKIRVGRRIVLEGKMPRRGQGMSIPEILQLYKEGLTIEEITVTARRSLAFVHCVLTEHGLPKSPVPLSCDIDSIRPR